MVHGFVLVSVCDSVHGSVNGLVHGFVHDSWFILAQLMISPLIVMFSPLKFQPLISNVSAANSLRFRR